MNPKGQRVEGHRGLRGTVTAILPESRLVEILLDTGERVHIADELLQQQPDGTCYLPLSPDDLRPAHAQPSAPPGETIPIAREELHISKRTRETSRTTVHVTPTVRTELVDIPLTDETVTIERIPINRPVDTPPRVREEADRTIIPVLEEVLVVEKRLILKEEIHILRHRTTRHEHHEIPLRSEQVKIERHDTPR